VSRWGFAPYPTRHLGNLGRSPISSIVEPLDALIFASSVSALSGHRPILSRSRCQCWWTSEVCQSTYFDLALENHMAQCVKNLPRVAMW